MNLNEVLVDAKMIILYLIWEPQIKKLEL